MKLPLAKLEKQKLEIRLVWARFIHRLMFNSTNHRGPHLAQPFQRVCASTWARGLQATSTARLMSWSDLHHPFKMDGPHQSNPEQNAPRPNPSFISHSPPRENWISVTGWAAGRWDRSCKAVPAVVTMVSTQPTASVACAWVPYPCAIVDVLVCGGARVPSRGSSGAVAARRAWCAAPSCIGEHPSQGVQSDPMLTIRRHQRRRGGEATRLSRTSDGDLVA
jgi:hypothetical protein